MARDIRYKDGTVRHVIQCNVSAPQGSASKGARAYLILPNPGNGNDRVVVLIRSRGGRWIEKWQDIRRLKDFRVKTLPPEHPLYSNERLWTYEPRRTAVDLNEARERSSGA